jgi:hypothetical protein
VTQIALGRALLGFAAVLRIEATGVAIGAPGSLRAKNSSSP